MLPRLFYVITLPSTAVLESIDAQGYHRLTHNLLAGHGFSLRAIPPYYPTSIRTPLYPALVAAVYALVGEYPQAIAVLQAALDSTTALLSAIIATRIAGRRTGLIAGLLYALTPSQWLYVGALLTETTLALFIALGIWLWVVTADRGSFPASIACGLAWGLAALCKPNAFWLGPILVPGAFLSLYARRGACCALGATAAILLAGGLVLSPWLVRNRVVFGRWYLSSAFRGGLIRITAPAALCVARDVPAIPWSSAWEEAYNELVAETAAQHGWTPVSWERLPPAEFERREQQVAETARGVVREHLAQALEAHWVGFFRSWGPLEPALGYERLSGRDWEATGVPVEGWANALALAWYGRWNDAVQEALARPWRQLPLLGRVLWFGWAAAYAAGGLLAVAGVCRLRHRPAVGLVLVATILYFTLLPGPIAYLRFRVPVVPLIAVLQAIGWSTWLLSPEKLVLPSRPKRSIL